MARLVSPQNVERLLDQFDLTRARVGTLTQLPVPDSRAAQSSHRAARQDLGGDYLGGLLLAVAVRAVGKRVDDLLGVLDHVTIDFADGGEYHPDVVVELGFAQD